MFVFPAPYVAAAGGVTSLAVQASATATDEDPVTGPASIIAGDLLVLSDYKFGGSVPPETVPSGFSVAQTATVSDVRHILSFKIADGSEASASLAGMDVDVFGGMALYVFRPDTPITTATDLSGGSQGTSGNPASQNVAASGGTPPLVVLGAYGAIGAINPRTFSPAKDGEISAVGTSDLQTFLAYKIYNTSPADVSIDMDDEGNLNTLLSCYIQVS